MTPMVKLWAAGRVESDGDWASFHVNPYKPSAVHSPSTSLLVWPCNSACNDNASRFLCWKHLLSSVESLGHFEGYKRLAAAPHQFSASFFLRLGNLATGPNQIQNAKKGNKGGGYYVPFPAMQVHLTQTITFWRRSVLCKQIWGKTGYGTVRCRVSFAWPQ